MSKTPAPGVVVLALVVLLGTGFAQQQSPATKVGPEEEKAATAYRLDFALNEMEAGKKINTRQYSLNIVPGSSSTNNLKIGTRIPVEIKQGEIQYIDVGTSIWAHMAERGDSVQLEVRADLSNFANPEQEQKGNPLIRQLQINASTVAVLGKPMIIGVVDDPNSKRQYQLEVTVTKLR